MSTLVIGYGNPLRGDDGFGYRLAERIPGAIAVHQLTPELMEPIAGAGRVLFLDTAAEGIAGEIRRRPVVPASAHAPLTHYATPESLLVGAMVLYGRAPAAEILTVGGNDFTVGAPLSGPVERALAQILNEFGIR